MRSRAVAVKRNPADRAPRSQPGRAPCGTGVILPLYPAGTVGPENRPDAAMIAGQDNNGGPGPEERS